MKAAFVALAFPLTNSCAGDTVGGRCYSLLWRTVVLGRRVFRVYLTTWRYTRCEVTSRQRRRRYGSAPFPTSLLIFPPDT